MYGHGMLFMTVRGEERTWNLSKKGIVFWSWMTTGNCVRWSGTILPPTAWNANASMTAAPAGQSLRRLLRRRAAGHVHSRSGRLAVLKQLRSRNEHVPVVIISAQTDVSDRIIGLELGADDYVPKTFSPRELLARLRAVMRRTRPSTAEPEEEHSLSVRGLVMNNDGMEASLEGRNLELGTMEFRLLYLLASHPGHVFTRESLLEGIAGRWYDGFDRSIDMHISSLRRKLGDSPRSSRWIRTVRGNGYMFVK